MVGTGLKATRKSSGSPLADSALHAAAMVGAGAEALPFAYEGIVVLAEPRMRLPAKPEPISKPLAAGRESIACASRASSLSKTGSPSPAGTLRQTQLMMPPTESCSAAGGEDRRLHRAAAAAAIAGSGPMVRSTVARSMVSGSTVRGVDVADAAHPGDDLDAVRCAAERVPAMAPAATRPMVSRALARPPPLAERRPYFIW